METEVEKDIKFREWFQKLREEFLKTKAAMDSANITNDNFSNSDDGVPGIDHSTSITPEKGKASSSSSTV